MATCSVEEIHVGDIGTQFQATLYDCDVVVDISTATVKEIIFLKPDGTKVVNTADFLTDGSDGIIYYAPTLATELDQEGNWKIQARVVMPTGTWSSDVQKFKVYPNL